MHIPFKQRLKLIRQMAYAQLGFRNHVPVRIEESPLGATITVEDNHIEVPSVLRWKLYKKGWRARLDQLENEYGVGHLVELNNDSVVLDIGANAGEFAHVAARYGARIYCIEPDPRAFACLRANISEFANTSAHDALIWKENAEIDFYSAPERADSSVFAEGDGPRLTKSAVTLDAFCETQGMTHIDLLKCDAEGAEPEVLEGARETLSNTSAVAIDTGAERNGARTNQECAGILRDNGFDVSEEKIGKRLMTFGVNRALADN